MAIKGPGYVPKKRNSGTKQERTIIAISAEGRNKTETLYLKKFNSDKVKVHFAHGQSTDPVKMMKELLAECKDQGIKPLEGDLAFCLIDSDANSDKDIQIAKAEKLGQADGARVIVSNPCFEKWFLCHFEYSTKQYSTNEQLLKDLDKKIPGYSKNRGDIYELLLPMLDQAITNADRLERNNLSLGQKPHTAEFNPSTEIYKIIQIIKAIEEEV